MRFILKFDICLCRYWYWYDYFLTYILTCFEWTKLLCRYLQSAVCSLAFTCLCCSWLSEMMLLQMPASSPPITSSSPEWSLATSPVSSMSCLSTLVTLVPARSAGPCACASYSWPEPPCPGCTSSLSPPSSSAGPSCRPPPAPAASVWCQGTPAVTPSHSLSLRWNSSNYQPIVQRIKYKTIKKFQLLFKWYLIGTKCIV